MHFAPAVSRDATTSVQQGHFAHGRLGSFSRFSVWLDCSWLSAAGTAGEPYYVIGMVVLVTPISACSLSLR